MFALLIADLLWRGNCYYDRQLRTRIPAKSISHYVDEEGVVCGYAFLSDGKPCLDLAVQDIVCGSICRGSGRIYGSGLMDVLKPRMARPRFDCPTL